MTTQEERVEALGPAERIIASMTRFVDHAVHNRTGVVFRDNSQIGARWEQAVWVLKDGEKEVYTVRRAGKKQVRTRIGILRGENVEDGARTVGRWQGPGLFPEAAAHIYSQIAEVWKVDNKFAAQWASWAFNNEDNRDLKVILAAFMLVQDRFGEPFQDGDERFLDEDYRAVGEAMCLLTPKKGTFNPKLLLRVGEVLELPGVIEKNRELGFGRSIRNPIIGRYYKVVEKWLRNVEQNPKVLEGWVSGGFRNTIMRLSRKVGYKPSTPAFFQVLRWKQVQAPAGHRTLAIGDDVQEADDWSDLSEEQICQKITEEKPNWKVLVGKLSTGITPAIVVAAMAAGSLSDNDLIILTPTLEEFGLLKDKRSRVYKKWKAATENAENQRSTNIAKNVRSAELKKDLEEAADKATAKQLEDVTRGMRIYMFVDKSGSMGGSLEAAKQYLSKFVGAFPLDKLHVAVFNTVGSEVEIKTPTAAGVRQAFRGHTAGGGTSYAAGVQALVSEYKTAEDEDALFIFVGDQLDSMPNSLVQVVRNYGVMPMAFGMLQVGGGYWGHGKVVEIAAASLGIPCFKIDEEIFADPYAVPRTIRNIVAATPVGKAAAAPRKRHSLLEEILKTKLLEKPAWA